MLCWLQNVQQPLNLITKGSVLFKLLIESLKSPLSNDIRCHTDCFESKAQIAVVWPETVRGCEQNSWFLYHEFRITNLILWIKNIVVTSFLRIFMNSFTQTSFLLAKLQICSYEFVRVFSMLRWEWPVLYMTVNSWTQPKTHFSLLLWLYLLQKKLQ